MEVSFVKESFSNRLSVEGKRTLSKTDKGLDQIKHVSDELFLVGPLTLEPLRIVDFVLRCDSLLSTMKLQDEKHVRM